MVGADADGAVPCVCIGTRGAVTFTVGIGRSRQRRREKPINPAAPLPARSRCAGGRWHWKPGSPAQVVGTISGVPAAGGRHSHGPLGSPDTSQSMLRFVAGGLVGVVPGCRRRAGAPVAQSRSRRLSHSNPRPAIPRLHWSSDCNSSRCRSNKGWRRPPPPPKRCNSRRRSYPGCPPVPSPAGPGRYFFAVEPTPTFKPKSAFWRAASVAGFIADRAAFDRGPASTCPRPAR